jgi:branched-chain amino acid transport system substrate-binding protein
VFAVIAISALTFAAVPFLTSHGIPVIGANEDGQEWLTSTNMFSPDGPADTTKIESTYGDYLKLLGVTNVGSIGFAYGRASQSAIGWADSAQAAGLKVGYLNSKVPLGTTNTGPIAIAMKNAGVDGLLAAISSTTYMSLIGQLHVLNVNLKTAIFPLAGGSLFQSGASAVQASQGISYFEAFEPVEMHTDATKRFQAALQATGGTTAPDFNIYSGYTSVLEFLAGLQAAGSGPTQAKYIAALNNLKDFSADGLLGTHRLRAGDRSEANNGGVDDCLWFVRLKGSAYDLVPGADPLCGHNVPGKVS